jgi:hypothetical protein
MAGVAGSQPSNLKSPTPMEDEMARAEALLADVTPDPAPPKDEEEMARAEALLQETQAPAVVPNEEFRRFPQQPVAKDLIDPEAPEFGYGDDSLEGLWQRAKIQHATTNPDEVANALENLNYDVRINETGQVLFKKKNENKFRIFDKNDSDLSLRALQTVAIDNMRIGSDGLFEVLSTPFAAVSAGLPAAAAAFGVSGGNAAAALKSAERATDAARAVMSMMINDYIAETIFEIERDPERSQAKEAALTASVAVATPMIPGLAGATARLGKKSINKAAKKVSTWVTEMFPRIFAKNEVVEKAKFGGMKANVLLQENIRAATEILDENGMAWIDMPDGTKKFVITWPQASGRASLKALQKEVNHLPEVEDYLLRQADHLYDSMTSVIEQAKKNLPVQGPIDPNLVIEDVIQNPRSLYKQFYKVAEARSKNKTFDYSKTKGKIQELAGEANMLASDVDLNVDEARMAEAILAGYKKPDAMQILAEQIGVENKGYALKYATTLDKVAKQFDGDQTAYKSFTNANDILDKQMASMVDKEGKVLKEFAPIHSRLNALKESIATDLETATESALEGTQSAENFLKAKQYVQFNEPQIKKLAALVKDNGPLNEGLIRNAFYSRDPRDVRLLKSLLLKEDPKKWELLQEQALDQLLRDATDELPKQIGETTFKRRINPQKLTEKLSQISDETMSQMFGENAKKQIKAISTLVNQINADVSTQTVGKPIKDELADKIGRKIVSLATVATTLFVPSRAREFRNLLRTHIDKENVELWNKLSNPELYEEMLKKTKPDRRGIIMHSIESIAKAPSAIKEEMVTATGSRYLIDDNFGPDLTEDDE